MKFLYNSAGQRVSGSAGQRVSGSAGQRVSGHIASVPLRLRVPGPGGHRGQPRCHRDRVTLPLMHPFAAPASVDVQTVAITEQSPAFRGLAGSLARGRRGQAMNNSKNVKEPLNWASEAGHTGFGWP